MNFHSPTWLYVSIVAVVAILAIYALSARMRKKNLEAFASSKLLANLSRTYSKTKAKIKSVLFILGVVAVFIALARPQYGYRWEESKAKGVDVIFAIDTSKSMLAEDTTPNRLERAKLAVVDLADMLKGDRVGIVAFSGQAFLQCPLTLDYDAFRMSLDVLDTNVIQRGGTNIAAAITEAETAFAKSTGQKILVLISDGEELEANAIAKAKDAAQNDIKIYTLGAGATAGQTISITDDRGRSSILKDENGNVVKSKLNEKVLTEIAQITGGFYQRLSTEAIEKIYTDGIKKAPQEELSARMKRLAIERFQIPLLIAIILLAFETLIGTRKFFISKGGLPVIAFLALVCVSPDTLQAQTNKTNPSATEAQPSVKLEEKSSIAPIQPTAKNLFNLALDESKNKNFAIAEKLFIDAMKLAPTDFKLHAKALYNIGNAKYKNAVEPLLDAVNSDEVKSQQQQALAGILQTISNGNAILQEAKPLLEQEKQLLKNAKSKKEKEDALKKSPLKNQQFQQKVKQAISQCEALEKLPDEVAKKIETSSNAWKTASKKVANASYLFDDALQLDPNLTIAQKNKKVASEVSKILANEMNNFSALKDENKVLANKAKNLTLLKEELKKLLRDDNNQNQQNNQQNQNNQNQQNKDNQQNQDNKQDNKQDKNQQNKNKSSQNNQQNQNNQNQQNKDNQQNQDNKQDNKQDKNQQNKNKSSQDKKQNQDKQNPDKKDSDQNKNQNDKNKQKTDNKQNQQKDKNDEQAVENKKKNEAQNKQQNQEKGNTKEQKQPAPSQEKQKQAQSAKEGEQEKDNFRKAEGVMTKAEAKQLLESMKDGEKILPLRGFGEQKNRFEKSYKDW